MPPVPSKSVPLPMVPEERSLCRVRSVHVLDSGIKCVLNQVLNQVQRVQVLKTRCALLRPRRPLAAGISAASDIVSPSCIRRRASGPGC